jgi:hypothetical protein
VAHSHGGNVVVEALPQIVAAPAADMPHGKIVTLGTPFMDTMSPILKQAKLRTKIREVMSWIVLALVIFALLYFMGDWTVPPAGQENLLFPPFFFLLVVLLAGLLFRRKSSNWWDTREGVEMRSPLLVIGSQMDETWQLLHHVRKFNNPFMVKESLPKYLLRSIWAQILLRAKLPELYDEKSFCDLEGVGKVTAGLLHFLIHSITVLTSVNLFIAVYYIEKHTVSTLLWSFVAILSPLAVYLLVLLLTTYGENTFHSAFL